MHGSLQPAVTLLASTTRLPAPCQEGSCLPEHKGRPDSAQRVKARLAFTHPRHSCLHYTGLRVGWLPPFTCITLGHPSQWGTRKVDLAWQSPAQFLTPSPTKKMYEFDSVAPNTKSAKTAALLHTQPFLFSPSTMYWSKLKTPPSPVKVNLQGAGRWAYKEPGVI